MELMNLFQIGKPGGSARITAADVCDDEGPFFELEFAAPNDEEERPRKERYSLETDSASESDESASEFGGSGRRDHILSLSPSDDLFFRGRFLPLEPSARLSRSSSSASKSKPQVASFLLKSAAKFRVFKLGLRMNSSQSTSADAGVGTSLSVTAESPKLQGQKHKGTLKPEDPAASIFTRDSSSSQISGINRSSRLFTEGGLMPSVGKTIHKDAVQRYLNKIKPLYVQVSKRYGEMLRFSGPLSSVEVRKVQPTTEGGDATGNDVGMRSSSNNVFKCQRPQKGSIPSGLKVASLRLRKSRSASASVNTIRSPTTAASGRRDDTLLAQQDGIQSAIAHCKRSFNGGSDSSETPLTRSMSEPGNVTTAEASAKDES